MLLYSNFLYSLYLRSSEFYLFVLGLLSIYSVYNFKYFKKPYNLILILILGFSFFEIASKVTSMIGFTNNHFVNHPYSVFTLIVSSIFFYKFIGLKWVLYFIILVNVIFIGLEIFQLISPNGILESPKYFSILSFSIASLGILSLTLLIKSKKIKSIKNEPIFWVSFGFVVMYLSLIILLPIFNYAIEISNDFAFIVGTIKNLADPITYTLWAIGIYKLKTQAFRPISSLWP